MSVFFCPKGNIDCAVRLFERQHRKPLELNQLGADLWRMNAVALEQRYGSPSQEDGAEMLAAIKGYRYRTGDVARVSDIQLIKAAQCLAYQCREGDVPEMDLFKELGLVIADAQDNVIRAIPAYQSAKWSFE